jgi:hypothetical protein
MKRNEIIVPAFMIETHINKLIYNSYIDGLDTIEISLKYTLITGDVISFEQINSIIDDINSL